MDPVTAKTFLNRLLKSITAVDFREALGSVGDYDAATLDTPFGKHKLVWRAFGGNPSNVSTIGLGTKPGRSLTERVTNAIDALLEARAKQGGTTADSPRHAAHAWYGRPMPTPDTGLYNWKGEPDGFDKKIHVVMHKGDKPECATIDVLDHGIGISGADFSSTILSLQGGNKIRKRHLIGAFGQGGSATLGFCTYALIVSRSSSTPTKLSFTVVRVLKLDASYKEDCFAYLAVGADKAASVLEVEVGPDPTDFFSDRPESKVPPITQGTLIRHINYRLTHIDKSLHSSPGNLYHYLHYSAFDPIVPFRLVDLRGLPEQTRNERISGSRNRLMSRSAKADEKDDDDSNIQVRHYRPMEYIVPLGSVDACIGVEYWVVLAFKKKAGEYELRGHSNELFVQVGHPIIGTLNGQNQGELTSLILKQLGFGLLSRHMIVHIDATGADSTVRRELFATSREGFKEGPVLTSILALAGKMLAEDEKLKELERELTDRITKKETESAKAEVKQEVSKLLREAGFAVKDPGKVSKEGGEDEDKVERKKPNKPIIQVPLPTLPYPQVSKFEIVYPIDVFQLPLNDTQSVVIETDADAQYDKHVHIRSEPAHLELASRAPLRGGRVRFRLRPVADAVAGSHGEVVATLTKPDGTQLVTKVLYELLPAQEKPSKKETGQIPPFEIIPVSPDDSEIWENLWPDDDGNPLKQQEHAYKSLNAGGSVNVYFSKIFSPYRTAIESLKLSKPSRLAPFETHYQVWIGYHAILQAQRQLDAGSGYDGTSEEVMDRLQELERQTVGRVQVRQALKTAELIEASLKASEV